MDTDDNAVSNQSLSEEITDDSAILNNQPITTDDEPPNDDVNFEELIAATTTASIPNNTIIRKNLIEKVTTNNLTQDKNNIITTNSSSSNNVNVISTNSTTTTNISSPSSSIVVKPSTSFIKLSPKSISGTIQKNPTTGQFVLIQSKTGVPVRISANPLSNNTTVTTTTPAGTTIGQHNSFSVNKQTAVQVIRTPDGNLVPVKTNKSINLSNVSIAGKKILTTNSTTGGGGTFILKNTTGFANVTGSSSSSSNSNQHKQIVLNSQAAAAASKPQLIKTICVSDAQKAKLQKMLPAIPSSSGTQKILLNTEKLDTNSHIIKLSHSGNTNNSSSSKSTGVIQTIQLPNKGGGFKYVRVLNPGASLSAKDGSSSRMTLLRQNDNIKMINKLNQQTIKQPSKLNTNSLLKDDALRLIPKLATVPTLRKINDETMKSNMMAAAAAIKREPNTTIVSPIKRKSPQLKQLNKARLINSSGSSGSLHEYHKRPNNKGQFVVVSQELFRSMKFSPKKSFHQTKISPTKKLYTTLKPSTEDNIIDESVHSNSTVTPKRSPTPDNGGIRRKHCNCNKSQCLKLYCDCFANGEFCQNCNCKECFNNLEYADERQKAIKMCLERNPAAFKPKITKARDQSDTRLHNKGCNCKRSGCLKNYCECYEAKIACSSNCKCLGCRNVEDRTLLDMTDVAKIAQSFGRGMTTKRAYDYNNDSILKSNQSNNSLKQLSNGGNSSTNNINDSSVVEPVNKPACNFITPDVVDATIQCMIAQADQCQKIGASAEQTESMILEELGRCLVEIIDFSIRNIDD